MCPICSWLYAVAIASPGSPGGSPTRSTPSPSESAPVGPVAFPHRFSSMADPLAPISHHWQDSTHISYGVLTAGVFTCVAKLEASWFNGREPDEERYDVDLEPAGVVRVAGDARCARARRASAALDRLGDALDDRRTARVDDDPRGRNVPEHARATDSALVETAVDLDGLGVTFARAEYVVKTGHDFALPDATPRSGSRSARSRSATSTGGS